MEQNFSFADRPAIKKKLKGQLFDLVVIGGGITGAGICLDAASRGLRTCLIEKGDFASGTSSKSTKLVHGGLRYLKQFDFWLVKEVGTERAIVHKLAPHLVIPEKMLLPLVEGGSYGKWLTSVGLKVYDILAQVGNDDKRRMLNKKEAMKLEPLLPKKRLNGAGHYAEYRTDDARLTIEVLKTALTHGATALNYAKVVDFIYKDEIVNGVKVHDQFSNEAFEIKSKYVVSAAGPWVDEIRGLNNSRKGKRLHLTKGVHIVFPFEKLPVAQSVYFDVPDGRMIFAIPRGKVTYVGTTDTNYNKDKDQVDINLADAIYLVSAVNNMFPKINLTLDDIESSWAGLRPLVHEEGRSASEISRKDEIFLSPSGLISIAGGKLTGYRKMAERVVDRVVKKMEEDHDIESSACQTHVIPISGNGFEDFKAVEEYIDATYARMADSGISLQEIRTLITNYGMQTEEVLEYFEKSDHGTPAIGLILAEFRFTNEKEMVMNPLDFYLRRTAKMYFDINSVKESLDEVIQAWKDLMEIGDEECSQMKAQILSTIDRHSNFNVERRMS